MYSHVFRSFPQDLEIFSSLPNFFLLYIFPLTAVPNFFMKLANNSSCSFRAGIANRYNAFIMMFPLPSFRFFQACILMISLTVFAPPDLAVVGGATPVSLAPAADTEETVVTINIKSREFTPNTLSVTVGQKTRLVLKNLDTELHAFLPVGLMTDIHLNVSGSGAPQFSKEGLSRVLLPTRGQTDIVFIPSHPGTFPYFCDLPGHVMQGTIVVHKNESMVD